MPIFISYSRENAEFASRLATELVKRNTYIWLDKWELKIGDSLIERIQQAITDTDALLVIMSKASVSSPWCKKELSAALTRELAEKKVLVLPILIEDCEIPLFLKDKVYADFRKDFSLGLRDVLDGVAAVTNLNCARSIADPDTNIDWAISWADIGKIFKLRCTFVQFSIKQPFSLLTEINITCNEAATKRYKQWENISLDWFGRQCIIDSMCLIESKDNRLTLDSDTPTYKRATVSDPRLGFSYDINIEARRLGGDTGKSILLDVNGYIKSLRSHFKSVSRRLTAAEQERAAQLLRQGV